MVGNHLEQNSLLDPFNSCEKDIFKRCTTCFKGLFEAYIAVLLMDNDICTDC